MTDEPSAPASSSIAGEDQEKVNEHDLVVDAPLPAVTPAIPVVETARQAQDLAQLEECLTSASNEGTS